MSQNFLEIRDVTFAASKKNKVNNVTFNVEKEGEIICLLGPSGIGKTTILRTIAGLEKIQSGKITLILRPFNFETFATTAYIYASQDLLEAAAAPSLFLILIASVFILFVSKYILSDN